MFTIQGEPLNRYGQSSLDEGCSRHGIGDRLEVKAVLVSEEPRLNRMFETGASMLNIL
jgi:hypothetical protein